MLGQVNIENKITLTFYNLVKSRMRVLNTDLAKINIQKLPYKVTMSAVFLFTYTNKRSTCKALYALWFYLLVSVVKR